MGQLEQAIHRYTISQSTHKGAANNGSQPLLENLLACPP
jgi:hypothetical protein